MLNPFPRHKTATRLITAAVLSVLAGCGGDDSRTLVDVPNSLVVADFNGDGLPDVAVATAEIDATGITQRSGYVGLIMNSKSSPGSFASSQHFTSSPVPPSGIAVGDISGKGTHDLAVANNGNGTVAVLMETAPNSGTFSAAKSITTGGQPNDVQLVDINGDGALDLIVADGAGAVEYLLQDPNNRGSFGAPVSLTLPQRGISLAVADLNGDGLPDMVVTSFDVNGSNGAVQVFFQDAAHPGSFLGPTTLASGCEPSQVRLTDLTGSGMKDVLVACQGLGYDAVGSPGLMVIRQTSAGVFGTPVMYVETDGSDGAGPISLDVGDINGDGHPDVVMSSMYPQGAGAIYVLLQDASNPGTFVNTGAPAAYGLGQPAAIALADVNNDGLLDIVLADSTTAGIMPNSATTPGTFGAELQIGY